MHATPLRWLVGSFAAALMALLPLGSGASADTVIQISQTNLGLQVCGTGCQQVLLQYNIAVVDTAPGGGPFSSAYASPSSLAFGKLLVGTTSSGKTATLKNTSSWVPLVIHDIGLTGANPADYLLDKGTCANVGVYPIVGILMPGQSCTAAVAFKPTTTGERDANLVFADNSFDTFQVVGLTGIGAMPTPSLTGAAFSDTTVGYTTTQNFVLSNPATATSWPLSVSTITITGADAAYFTTTAAGPATVAEGGSLTIPVKFAPDAARTFSATLTVNDNAAAGFQSIALTGKGIAAAPGLTFSTTGLNFPDQKVNTSSAPLDLVVKNTGNTDIHITALAKSGSNPGDFAVSGITVPVTLHPGDQATLHAVFTPSAVGARSASLVFTDDGPGSPQSVSLTGNGVAAAAAVTNTGSVLAATAVLPATGHPATPSPDLTWAFALLLVTTAGAGYALWRIGFPRHEA